MKEIEMYDTNALESFSMYLAPDFNHESEHTTK